jgi:glycerol-3-phosphate dehydrogenase
MALAVSEKSSGPGPVEVLVVGGGVNGCGVARDAAGRGYSVMLVEMNDLASGTSSRTTKLIHGGLRYLEHFEFRLVREALAEREVLWANAPHLVRPLRFVLPWRKGLRPVWLLRLGLFLYDHMGGRQRLAATRTLDLARDVAGEPLKPAFAKGFEYSDCWVDDARFVALNARDAADRGAIIRTRTQLTSARPVEGGWIAEIGDLATGAQSQIAAQIIVNAAGPWVDQVIGKIRTPRETRHVRLVQGSHIVVAKLFEHDRCYVLQNPDRRIIFAIPYEDDFTLIGTTDLDFCGDPAKVAITPAETAYLCDAVSACFKRAVTPMDVVWSFSGVRPLFDDHVSAAQEATRDYVISDEEIDGSPLIHIFGGKITTHRRLAEEILALVGNKIGARGAPWTFDAPLPGGDIPGGDLAAFTAALCASKPFLGKNLAHRLARSYGTRVWSWLGAAESLADLGRDFGAGLTCAEVNYLVEQEWARTAEDILWRRSKLGLRLSEDAAAAVDAYLVKRGAGA